MKTIKFKCEMFVTLKYKTANMNRNSNDTLEEYLKSWKNEFQKNGNILSITEAKLIKEYCKGFSNDCYAIGNRYELICTISVPISWNKETIRFMVYHTSRNDYWCVAPIRIKSIKFI